MNLRVRGEHDDGPEATDRRVGGVARSLVCVGVCSGLEAPTRTRGWCVLCERPFRTAGSRWCASKPVRIREVADSECVSEVAAVSECARAPFWLVRTVRWCVRDHARVYVYTRSTRYEVKAVWWRTRRRR